MQEINFASSHFAKKERRKVKVRKKEKEAIKMPKVEETFFSDFCCHETFLTLYFIRVKIERMAAAAMLQDSFIEEKILTLASLSIDTSFRRIPVC